VSYRERVPLHPLIVHIPLVLAGLTPLITGFLAWHAWRGGTTRRAWLVPLALQLVIFVGAWLAMSSGEDQAEIVRAVVPRGSIGEHAHAAQWFTWATFATLVVIGAAVALRGRRVAIAGVLATALALATVGLGVRAGHRGARLVFEYDAPSAYRPVIQTAAPAR